MWYWQLGAATIAVENGVGIYLLEYPYKTTFSCSNSLLEIFVLHVKNLRQVKLIMSASGGPIS